MAIDLTRLSEKGQVVIPNEIRKKMRLKEGMRFVVMGLNDTIVLRKLELTRERLRLKQLLQRSRTRAAKAGFTEREIDKLIHETRKVKL